MTHPGHNATQSLPFLLDHQCPCPNWAGKHFKSLSTIGKSKRDSLHGGIWLSTAAIQGLKSLCVKKIRKACDVEDAMSRALIVWLIPGRLSSHSWYNLASDVIREFFPNLREDK